MKSNKANLIVFRLCDNDFSYHIKKAVELAVEQDFYEEAGEDCQWWKSMVINFVLAFLAFRRPPTPEREAQTRAYLESSLSVFTAYEFPTYDGTVPIDDDGGSVLLDIHNQFVTQF